MKRIVIDVDEKQPKLTEQHWARLLDRLETTLDDFFERDEYGTIAVTDE